MIGQTPRENDRWDAKQERGLVEYRKEIETGVHTFDPSAKKFGEFCGMGGRILDIGCGIRSTLQYTEHTDSDRLIGVDPLKGDITREFPFIMAVGEHLPFKDGVFDHVVFATSLDHFIEPKTILYEANRVLKPSGKINIWCGCFDWMEWLARKELGKSAYSFFKLWEFRIGKKDAFHFNRFTSRKILFLLRRCGFKTPKLEKLLSDNSTVVSSFFQASKRK